MVNAIVYTSETGHTKEYAKMLSSKLDIPMYEIKEAKINKNEEIIYLGWICAGLIKGLNKVRKKYNIKCCVAVGAYPKEDKYIEQLKNSNKINTPLFYLQGGIDYTKLKGIKRKIVQMVGKVLEKENPENNELIEIFKNGKNFVAEENLVEIIDFIKKV